MPAQGATAQGQRGYPPPLLSWLVWGLGALFYLMAFYQRVAPAVITQELMSEFQLNAAALGNLSAYYFYAYVAMQIPTGVIADHWGPRRLLSAGAVGAGVGAMLFGLSPTLGWAEAGRLLVGGSVAVAWVALLKLAAHWFAPRRFAMVSGMALLVGLAGAVGAGVPLRLMVDAFGWRPVLAASGGFTLVLAAAIWLFIRNDPSERGYQSFAPAGAEQGEQIGILRGLGQIWRYRNTWLLFATTGGVVGPVLTFAGLWGVPYLGVRYGLSPAEGAAICSLMLVGWGVGGPIIGGLSDRVGRRKALYHGGGIVALFCWLVALFVPGIPLGLFVALMIISGLASGGDRGLFRLGQGVGAAPPGGHGEWRHQHGIHVGPHLYAAPGGLGPGRPLAGSHAWRRPGVQPGGLSGGLCLDDGLERGRRPAGLPGQGNLLPPERLTPRTQPRLREKGPKGSRKAANGGNLPVRPNAASHHAKPRGQGMGEQGKQANERNIFPHKGQVNRTHREKLHGHASFVVWFTGLPSSGKSTIGHQVEKVLFDAGCSTYTMDGDNVRTGLCCDLGFGEQERAENIRRIGETAKLFVDAGIIVIGCFISPRHEDRDTVRRLVGPENFVEVFVDCPVEVCGLRDPKGNYEKARKGIIQSFTGVSAPYERPEQPDLMLPSQELDPFQAADLVMALLRRRGLVV